MTLDRAPTRLVTGTVAAVIALGPALALVTVGVGLTGRHVGPFGARLGLALVWLAMAVLVARPAAGEVIGRSGRARTVVTLAAVGATTAAFAVLPSRLLSDSVPLAGRLTWLLGMEDNARFVGVARELIEAPAGGRLAETFGTGFVAQAILVLDVLGPARVSADPRVAAIDAITFSVILAIVLVGATVATSVWAASLVGVPSRSGPVALGITAVGGAVATSAAIGLAVVVPVQLGFLSFVWGIVWLALAVSIGQVAHRSSSRRGPVALLALAGVAATLLAIRSWPFLLAGLAPLLLVLASRLRTSRAASAGPRSVLRSVGFAVIGVAVLAVAARILWRSPIGSVLSSVGLDALTVGGTVITTDGRIVRGAVVLTALGVLIAVIDAARDRSVARIVRIRAVLVTGSAAVAAVGLSLAVLVVLSASLGVDGIGYGGAKLLHAFTALAMLLALPELVARAANAPRLVALPAGAVLVATLISGGPQGSWEDLERFARPLEAPHAVALATAIQRSTPDTPIRCLPATDVNATSAARWAAYFCINWSEDAFNRDRQDGYRMDVLQLEDARFDDLVARILRDSFADYVLAERITAGPGWAHWDGRS
jgi:hypothetical protein